MDQSVSNVAKKDMKEDVGRAMGTPELIDRLAKEMRLRSCLDLPHAYFVEQVKLQLSGSPAFDASLAAEARGRLPAGDRGGDAFYRAWALREQ